MRTPLLLAALVVANAASAAAQTSGGDLRPASTGVYTDSEAVKGENVYKATCSSCHTTSDQAGPQFKVNWVGKTVYDYIANLKKTMPDDNPGGLSDDEYKRVTAYILKLNGYRPGPDPLPADTSAMKLIKMDTLPSETSKSSNRTNGTRR